MVNFPIICRKNRNINRIIETGEPYVEEKIRPKVLKRIPISEWMPQGLSHSFPADFFYTKVIPGESNSGMVRKAAVGNQNMFTHETCFVIPILRYQRSFRITKPNGKVVLSEPEVRGKKPDCLAFVAITRPVQINLIWHSGDDLDLAISAPDGQFVNFRQRRNACMALNNDINVDACDLRKFGTEVISVDRSCPDFQPGLYTINVTHATNCKQGKTSWEVQLVEFGRVVRSVTGDSDFDRGQQVKSFTVSL